MAKKQPVKKKAAAKTSTKAKTAKKPLKQPATKKKANQSKRGKNNVDLECFLSTACIQHKQLPDQCDELKTLRAFRDGYMSATSEGKLLVENYYRIGPGLVRAIEQDSNKAATYRYIYACIQKACAKIVLLENADARNIYTKMVRHLSKKYASQG